MNPQTTSEQRDNIIANVNCQTMSGTPVTEFKSLFLGRTEVVALGSKYTTAVSDPSELDTHFLNHLNGVCRMGCYNFLPDGNTPWAMIEFEDHGAQSLPDPKASVLQAIEHFQSCGIHCYPELSKNPGGKCYHLWIFFDRPVSAKKVHIALNSFVKNVLGISTEVFPKGYNTDSIGNMAWLPLFPITDTQGMGTAQNRTVFIDSIGSPISDQFQYLQSIQRNMDAAFDAFVSEYNLPVEEVDSVAFGREEETLDADLQKVRTCSFMKHCEDNAATLSELEWYPWITNAIRCTGGREYIHQYSSQYPSYSKIKTDKKIAHALRDTGPMTHETIAAVTGFKCDCAERFKAPVSRSTYIDVQAEAKRLVSVVDIEERSKGIRALVRYINRQEPIEKELYKQVVKSVLKLNVSIFDDVCPNGRPATPGDLKGMLSVMKPGSAGEVEKAKTIYAWLRDEKKAQYFTDDNSRHYIYINQKLIPIETESSELQSLLLSHADVSTATQFGRVVIQVMNASTHAEGKRIQRNTWLETKRRKLEVYFNLKNGRNELLKISPDACTVIQNGGVADEVLMLDTLEDKLKPIEFIRQDDGALKIALEKCEELIIQHIPCVQHEKWFAYAWRMSIPLYDFTTMHLTLRAQGKPGMGKSTACKILTMSLYGAIYENKNTVASLYSDASINPLVVEDNLESRAFNAETGHADFYLSAATGGGKQKRDSSSGSGLIIEKIRSLLLCNGIESIAKSEQTSRMMIIECDKTLYGSEYSTGILLDLELHRNEMMSAEFILTQRVLKRIQIGDWNAWQTKLTNLSADHPKSRMFEHLAIMIMYLEEFSKAVGSELKIDDLLKEWMDSQKISATTEIIESDPIIQAIDIIKESAIKQFEYDAIHLSAEAYKERNQVIKLDVKTLLCKRMEVTADSFVMAGTAGQLLTALSTAAKVHLNGVKFSYYTSKILVQRLSSVKAELEAHGYSLTEIEDKHLKQWVYTLEWKREVATEEKN